jgi:PLP dependent protein
VILLRGFSLYVDCRKYCARARAIDAAARRTGRDPDRHHVDGVSKTFPAESIREAYAAGLALFGENRVQEFAGKADSLRDLHAPSGT